MIWFILWCFLGFIGYVLMTWVDLKKGHDFKLTDLLVMPLFCFVGLPLLLAGLSYFSHNSRLFRGINKTLIKGANK